MDDEDRYTRITLRIPKDLHRSLSDSAERSSKSLNAEIVGRLTETFRNAGATSLSPRGGVVLQALAGFVVLRHSYPDVMASMEESMVNMANAVKDAHGDIGRLEETKPWLDKYVAQLTEVVKNVNNELDSMPPE